MLAQAAVADADEVAACTTALTVLPDRAGCLITADAVHSQRGHADFLPARGGHYLFTVRLFTVRPTRPPCVGHWLGCLGAGPRRRVGARAVRRGIKTETIL